MLFAESLECNTTIQPSLRSCFAPDSPSAHTIPCSPLYLTEFAQSPLTDLCTLVTLTRQTRLPWLVGTHTEAQGLGGRDWSLACC